MHIGGNFESGPVDVRNLASHDRHGAKLLMRVPGVYFSKVGSFAAVIQSDLYGGRCGRLRRSLRLGFYLRVVSLSSEWQNMRDILVSCSFRGG